LAKRETALLQAVHAHPGLTRVAAAGLLGIGTGAATEVVARLVEAGLLAEEPAAPTGARGRPTRHLAPHPDGPLVLACAITQESWRVDAVQLGGEAIATILGEHRDQGGPEVLSVLAAAIRRLRRRFHGRIRGLGVSVPGTILGGRMLDAVGLGWKDLDLRALWPDAGLFAAGNDATLAALAESERGAAIDASLALHLRVEAGLGGAVIDHGRLLTGVRGVAGEFGHMPFGDPAVTCPCGARGCWGTEFDGRALARLMGGSPPGDPVTYARRLLARAAAGEEAELHAARAIAIALGRGIAGLVNGFDPDLVTLGGLGADVLTTVPDELHTAYRQGLMDFTRATPPPVVEAALGDAGPLIGAAEQVWTQLWPDLLREPGGRRSG
jgi:predicted NBD/HSP70 family sugar kinase